MENTQSIGVPKIDLNHFFDSKTKIDFVNSIGSAFEEIGFVAIKNHGVSEDLLAEFYHAVKDFFALPINTKNKYNDHSGGQRGYTPFGVEHAKNRPSADLKEFWHFGQWVQGKDETLEAFYPKNKEVNELPRFIVLGKEIYKALETTAAHILRAIALYLNLPENYFEDKIFNGNSILRPIHYPPITAEPASSIRAGEHEDINLITLLVGASADGLQVLNKNQEWVGVTKVTECIIVNVGDMLQRLTNNKLKSTTHRVINPPKEKWGESRYSIPFFLHPRPEVSLACLNSCVDEKNIKKYEDIIAIEYLNQRLREIGLIK